jgi:regulatory protein
MTYRAALEKARQYCAYQERCISEVTKKLKEWDLETENIKSIITQLEKENYVDEDRFARVFAGGKFRIKKWGKNKITAALRMKKIPEECIQLGLKEIDDQEYIETMISIINKKKEEYNELDNVIIRNKLYNFVLSKGYEKHIILKYL